MQVRKMTTIEVLKQAKAASRRLSILEKERKNDGIRAMADALVLATDDILAANAVDIQKAQENGMGEVMQDRLRLTPERIMGMADGMREVAALPDPTGKLLSRETRPNGLIIEKVSVPMGVVAIIFESRPNVTSDAAALTLKSGNVCVLKGGKEAFNSISAIIKALKDGLKNAGLDEDFVNMVPDPSREGARLLMTANGLVDLLIPRGGAGLIRACVEGATVPCIQTGTGICHIYVDGSADLQMALDIVENAKTSRPSVCNAAEVCLVSEKIANEFLPLLKDRLVDKRAAAGLQTVEIRGCEKTAKIIDVTPAGEADFDTEFLNYILAVKVVSDVNEAVGHIDAHSTHHSEAIIATDPKAAGIFTCCVDSSSVYVNASTRFTDGGEFGLGCEIGISTQKLHARGPMGLEGLTTYKYVICGEGQIR